MDWDEYRVFLVVARSRSVREAAQTLEVSHSTVLRKIDQLESRLGARLFDRLSVGFQLTSVGEDVLQGANDIEESIQGIDRLVTGRDGALEGLVRISMPAVLVHQRLFPDVKSFNKQFPGIKLEVELSYQAANLARREADLAIRFTQAPPEDLIGRKLGSLAMVPYATQAYLKKHDPLDTNSGALVIAYGNPDTWSPPAQLAHLDVLGFYDDIALQINLTKQGAGVGILPSCICDAEPSLVRVTEPVVRYDLWVLYHTDLRYTSRVRAVRDFVLNSMSPLFDEPCAN